MDDMVDASTGYADAMLQEFEARFSGGKKRRRSKDPDLDPDDDD